MALWALRDVILGDGAWRMIRSEEQLLRLQNSPRRRTLAAIPRWFAKSRPTSRAARILILTPMGRLGSPKRLEAQDR
jgi:hypothetical protein